MKRKITFLIAALFALMMVTLPGKVMGQTKSDITLTANSGFSSSYSSDHTFTVSGIGFKDSGVMYNGNGSPNGFASKQVIQFRKSANGAGVLFNTSAINTITSVVVTLVNNNNGFSVYYGNTQEPSTSSIASSSLTPVTGSFSYTNTSSGTSSATSYTFTFDLSSYSATYFRILNGSSANYVGSIVINYSTGYSVTYVPGEGATGSNVVDNNVSGSYTVRDNNGVDGNPCFTKVGHIFNCWNDGSSNVNVGANINITSNVTLTAQWTPVTYTITYEAGEGTGFDVIETKTYGVDYTILDKPNTFTAPTGKPYFNGWLGSDSKTYAVGATYSTNADLTLTAQWSATALYTVSYDCNGGESGCPNNETVLDGTEITLPAAPAYVGHTFNGWMCDADLETYAAGAQYTVESDVEFEAQWLENLANPTFTVTGVSNGTANTYYATASVTIQAANDATIYYTTDGTDPSLSSSVYSEAITVNTEGTNTIKAFATKAGNGPSAIASKTVIIINRADAEFTEGVYATLNSSDAFNTWYAYSVTGNQVWEWSSTYAKMTGYVNSTNYENEDWLISPKMHAVNGKLAVAFQCVGRYGNSGMATVYYSTNYPGYGNPNSYTWTEITTDPATLPYAASNWNFTDVTCTLNNEDVYFAVKYISSNTKAGTLEVKNFTAKQCYPITYYANGGTGTTADANSPYAVGTEVTILENGFTAPSGKEFTSWNTQANGEGTEKNPGQNITMTTAGYELYAQWGDACVLAATMNATTGEAAYNYNSGNKRFDISLSSSVHVLGGCDIFDYGFVYSTTVTTPTIGADNCTKVQVGDSQPTIDDPFEATIEDVTKEATYHVRSYATNAAGTAYSDVIDVEVPANFPVWTISYTTNGTADGTTTVDKGDAISGLATPTPANIPAGYTFTGWYGDDYALNNVAPTFVKNGDAINSDLALKAVFAIQTGGGSADTYSLVENVNDLHDGDIVVLYSTGSYTASQVVYDFSKANGGISNNLFSDVDVTVDNNQFTSSDVEPMTLVASGNSWKLQIGNQYVSAVNKGVSLDNTGSLNTITISDGTATITATISSTNYRLQYNPNNGNGRFAYYSSTQKSVKLYKQDSPIYSSYCTSVSPAPIPVDGNGEMTGNTTIPSGAAYTITTPVTVPEGITLTVNGTLGNDNPANLIIEDGGQVIVNNTGVQATVKKSVDTWSAKTASGWQTISTSTHDAAKDYVSFSNVTNLVYQEASVDKYNVYKFNEPNTTWLNNLNTSNSFSQLDCGRGYLYRTGSSEDIAYTGELNYNDVEVDLSYTCENANYKGFNLIGNPYSHSIYKGAAGSAIPNGTLLAEKYYALDKEDGTFKVKNDGTEIPTGTAILVQAIDQSELGNNYTLTIANSTSGATAKDFNGNIWFTVKNSEFSDVACVEFKEGRGLNKMKHYNENAPMLYINHDGESFASVNLSEDTRVFDLSFKAQSMSRYTLSAKANGNFSYFHLIDRLTGEDVDMLLEGEYSFIANPSDNANRFIVRLSETSNYDDNNESFAFQNGNDIVVKGNGELQVFDVIGRMVMNQHINGVQTVNVNAQGVYIFRLIGNEIQTQKIVVK